MRLKKEFFVYGVSFLLLAGALSVWWHGFSANSPVQGTDIQLVEQDGAVEKSSEEEAENANQGRTIFVHVAGAVKAPGVYQLKEGQRVFEAVQMAGPTEDAYLDGLNLALCLKDQDKIYVPKMGEGGNPQGGQGYTSGAFLSGIEGSGWTGVVEGSGSGQAWGPQFPININTASASQLDCLPGIGPSLAAAIINYRSEFGPFQNPEDIMKVPGIGPKTYEKLSKLITTR